MSGRHVELVPLRSVKGSLAAGAGRFALGLPVWGSWQSDADWLAWGTKPLGRRPPRELGGLRLGYRPGYQRMIFRWSITAAVPYELIGASEHPWTTGFNTAAGVAAVAGAYGYKAWKRHNQDSSEPARNALQLQLTKLLDTPYANAQVKSGVVTVELPKDFVLSENSAKALHDLVQRTMGSELDVEWPNLLSDRVVTWTKIPEPPAIVRYEAIRDLMLGLPDGRLYLGVDAREQHVFHDLDTDAPHIALSMPTGRGKTTTFRLFMGQLIEQGAGIDLLDVKRISLNEFRNVPTVRLVRDIPRCWDSIDLFNQEIGERYRLLEDKDPEEFDEVMKTWRRRVLFIEELNAFRQLSQAYWDTIRTSKDRATPPVFETLSTVLFMARQVKMHVIVSSQRFEARTIGGGASREQFGLRLLSNPTKQDWAMFGSGQKPRGAYARHAGRSVAVIAGQASAVQLGYLTLPDVRWHIVTVRSALADVLPSYLETSLGESQEVSYDTPTLVTLSDYARENGHSIDALRKQVQRSDLEPVGVGPRGAHLYRPDDLTALRTGTPSYDPTMVIADED